MTGVQTCALPIFFSDSLVTSYGQLPYKGNFQRVNFYSDPNCIDLIKKQLFTLIKFYFHFRDKEIHDPLGYIHNNTKNILYKLKTPLKYKSGKSHNNLLSIRDEFILQNKNSDIYKIYKDGLTNFQKNCPIKIEYTKFFETKKYAIDV